MYDHDFWAKKSCLSEKYHSVTATIINNSFCAWIIKMFILPDPSIVDGIFLYNFPTVFYITVILESSVRLCATIYGINLLG